MGSKKNQLENEVESYLTKRVGQLGGRCVKFVPDFARGFPDRLVLLPHGVTVWVETKRPVGGVIDPAQLVQHENLRRLGQLVYLAHTKEEVDRILQRYEAVC
jgi:hypothetical protein